MFFYYSYSVLSEKEEYKGCVVHLLKYTSFNPKNGFFFNNVPFSFLVYFHLFIGDICFLIEKRE